jgi:hypothetical protein
MDAAAQGSVGPFNRRPAGGMHAIKRRRTIQLQQAIPGGIPARMLGGARTLAISIRINVAQQFPGDLVAEIEVHFARPPAMAWIFES